MIRWISDWWVQRTKDALLEPMVWLYGFVDIVSDNNLCRATTVRIVLVYYCFCVIIGIGLGCLLLYGLETTVTIKLKFVYMTLAPWPVNKHV